MGVAAEGTTSTSTLPAHLSLVCTVVQCVCVCLCVNAAGATRSGLLQFSQSTHGGAVLVSPQQLKRRSLVGVSCCQALVHVSMQVDTSGIGNKGQVAT
eukprot:6467492-Amphidinium_carterae.1